MSIQRLPFTLTQKDGATSIMLGDLDLFPHMESVEIYVDGQTAVATIRTPITVDRYEFPTGVTVIKSGTDFLDEITAAELNNVLASGGMGTNQGEAILEHLRGKAGQPPQ